MILNSKGIVIIWFWPTWVESCYVLSLTGQTIAVGFKQNIFALAYPYVTLLIMLNLFYIIYLL